jgi:protocatechuate 3,4-dioxygenase, beta subunit
MTAPGTSGAVPVVGYERQSEPAEAPLRCSEYRSNALRAPGQPLVLLPHTLTEVTGPVLGDRRPGPRDNDLTAQHAQAPLGQRINVSGRVVDGDGRPLAHTLIEVWQANAAGRYRHAVDRTPAPLDPNFTGVGRCLTDEEGRYRFVTVKPGAYPWGNHPNAWRPPHVHFSLLGRAFAQRLVTQMYFRGDPLLESDPIFMSVRDRAARERMLARFDWGTTEEGWALGYCFDIVLRGRERTIFEEPDE